MIKLTKGKIENKITHNELFELVDLLPLVFNGEASINSTDLSKLMLEKIVSIKDRDIKIYYQQWSDVCELAIKYHGAKIERIEEINILDKYEILSNIKNYSDVEKYQIAISLAKTSEDYMLIEDSFNKKVIFPDNALRRLISNE